jgi:hypothetical protein
MKFPTEVDVLPSYYTAARQYLSATADSSYKSFFTLMASPYNPWLPFIAAT